MCVVRGEEEEMCSLSVLTPVTGVSRQLVVVQDSQVRVKASPNGWLLGSSSSLISNSFLTISFPATPTLPQTHNSRAHTN